MNQPPHTQQSPLGGESGEGTEAAPAPAQVASQLPSAGPDRVDPPPLPATFAGVALRPPGSRYGDGDLVPGGSLDGGMSMGPAGVRRMVEPGGYGHGTGRPEDHIRFDPIFPGQPRPGLPSHQPRQPWNPHGPGSVFPGEPDPDHFTPFQGGPNQPFGGPGGGQFGPGYGGGFGGPGGLGGFP